jgi:hypothetical protein
MFTLAQFTALSSVKMRSALYKYILTFGTECDMTITRINLIYCHAAHGAKASTSLYTVAGIFHDENVVNCASVNELLSLSNIFLSLYFVLMQRQRWQSPFLISNPSKVSTLLYLVILSTIVWQPLLHNYS